MPQKLPSLLGLEALAEEKSKAKQAEQEAQDDVSFRKRKSEFIGKLS